MKSADKGLMMKGRKPEMKTYKRLLAMLMALIMLTSMVHVAAFAEDDALSTGADIAVENTNGSEKETAREETGGSPRKSAHDEVISEYADRPVEEQSFELGGEKTAEGAPVKKAEVPSNGWVEPPSPGPTQPTQGSNTGGTNEDVSSSVPSGETGDGGSGNGYPEGYVPGGNGAGAPEGNVGNDNGDGAPVPTYANIMLVCDEGGSVTELSNTAKPGSLVRFKTVPETDYSLDSVSVRGVGGSEVAVSSSGGSHEFIMPASGEDVTVTVQFKTATPSSGEGPVPGEGVPSGVRAVTLNVTGQGQMRIVDSNGDSTNETSFAKGETVYLHLTADLGFELKSLTMNGTALTAMRYDPMSSSAYNTVSYNARFTMPDGAVTVEAVFGSEGGVVIPGTPGSEGGFPGTATQADCSVTLKATGNGVGSIYITDSHGVRIDKTAFSEGETVYLYIEALDLMDGKSSFLKSLAVNRTSIGWQQLENWGVEHRYAASFTMPGNAVTVEAVFDVPGNEGQSGGATEAEAPDLREIRRDCGGGGSFEDLPEKANVNDKVQFRVVPETDYSLDYVHLVVENVPTVLSGTDGAFEFVMPDCERVTVVARFKKNTTPGGLPTYGESGNQEDAPDTYPVTLICDPEGGGSIRITNTSSTTGGKESFAEGETVCLSIVANSGYTFNGLTVNEETVAVSVNLLGGGYSASFDMPGKAAEVKAAFTGNATYSVTVTDGAVVGGISVFTPGATVTVRAYGNTNKWFKEWSGADELVFTSGNARTRTASFIMPAQDVTLTATYDDVNVGPGVLTAYTLEVSVSPEGAGSADYTAENYNDISLNATSNKNYAFEGWYDEENELLSADPDYAFTLTRDLRLTARFYRTRYTVSVQADPAEGGSVSASSGWDSSLSASHASIYAVKGASATVTATANPGYTFVGWYDGENEKSKDASYTFTPDGDVVLTAKFQKDKIKTKLGLLNPLLGLVDTLPAETFDRRESIVLEFLLLTEAGDILPHGTAQLSQFTATIKHQKSGVTQLGAEYFELDGLCCTLTIPGNELIYSGEHNLTVSWAGNETYEGCSKTIEFTLEQKKDVLSFVGIVCVRTQDGSAPPTISGRLRMNITPGQPDSGAAPLESMAVHCEIQHAPNAPRPWHSGRIAWTEQDGSFTITISDAVYNIFRQQGGKQCLILSVDPTDSHTGVRVFLHIDYGTGTAATHTVTVNANPSEGGTVTASSGQANGASISVAKGEEVTVAATANPGYAFVGWYNGETPVTTDNLYTFTPAGDVTLTAKFKLKTELKCDDEDALADVRIDVGENWLGTFQVNTKGGALDKPNFAGKISVSEGLDFEEAFDNFTVYARGSKLGKGEHDIVISYAGDDNHAPCSVSFKLTVFEKKRPRVEAFAPSVAVFNEPYTISGRIVDENGEPCADMKVWLGIKPNENAVNYLNLGYATTDAEGRFSRKIETNLPDAAGNREIWLKCYASDTHAAMTEYRTISFSKPKSITLSASPAEGGTVTGGGTYPISQPTTITATPSSGYVFAGWYDGGKLTPYDATQELHKGEEVNLTARFVRVDVKVEYDEGWPFSGQYLSALDSAEGWEYGHPSYSGLVVRVVIEPRDDVEFVYLKGIHGNPIKQSQWCSFSNGGGNQECISFSSTGEYPSCEYLFTMPDSPVVTITAVVCARDNGQGPGGEMPKPTKVTLTASSASKTYDGMSLTEPGFTAVGLPDGLTVQATMTAASTITNAGEQANEIDNYKIIDEKGLDKTGEFFVDTVPGLLTVEKRKVTLASASAAKEYDGAPLTMNVVEVHGDGFASGEGVSDYSFTGMQTIAGSSRNTFTYTLNEGTLADNYIIMMNEGDLEVNQRPVTITVHSANKVEGTEDPEFTGTVDGLVDPTDLGEIKYVRTNTDRAVGTYKGVLDATYTDNGNYAVTVQKGDFTITAAPVQSYTLAVQVNDGQFGTVTPESESGVKGHTVQLTANANSGYTFAGWQVENNFGYTGSIDDPKANPATFTFGEGDGSVTALFQPVKPGSIYVEQSGKTDYVHGDTLDTTGLEISGLTLDRLGNELICPIFSGYTIEYQNGDCLRKGDTSVTIEYNGLSCKLNGLNVGQKELSLSASIPDCHYGTAIQTPYVKKLDGVVDGDKVDCAFNGMPALEDPKNPYVGNDKTVTNCGFSLTGKDADNYTLAHYKLTVNVVPAEQTLSITPTAEMKTNGSLNLKDLVSGAQGGVSFFIASNGANAVLDATGTKLISGAEVGEVVLDVYAAAKDLNGDGQPEYKERNVGKAITVTITPVWRVSYTLDGTNGSPAGYNAIEYWDSLASSPNECAGGESYTLPAPPTTTSEYNGQRKGTWSFAWTVKTKGGVDVPVANNSFTMPEGDVNVIGSWAFTPNEGTRPEIITTALPDAVTGIEYQVSVGAISDTQRIKWTWSIDGLSGDLTASAVETAHGNALQITGTPRTAGNYTVTVRTENNAGYDVKEFPLTVKQGYSLQASAANANAGTAAPSSASGVKGHAVPLEATPNSGYTFWKWQLADGSSGAISDSTATPTTFTFGEGNAEVQALFRRDTEIGFYDQSPVECDAGKAYILYFAVVNADNADYNGKLSVTVDGKPYAGNITHEQSFNRYYLKLNQTTDRLAAGAHTVKVSFAGTDDYTPCEASFELKVIGKKKLNVKDFSPSEVVRGRPYTISGRIVDDNGAPYDGEVEVFIDVGQGYATRYIPSTDRSTGDFSKAVTEKLDLPYGDNVTVTIRIIATDDFEELCEVFTIPVVALYSLNGNVTPSGGGTVVFKKGDTVVTEAEEGEQLTLCITPEDGYEFSSMESNPDITTSGSPSAWGFKMPAKDLTVNAKFKRVTKIVTGGSGNTDAFDTGESYSLLFAIDGLDDEDRTNQISVIFDENTSAEKTDGYTLEFNNRERPRYKVTLPALSLPVGNHTMKISFAGDDGYKPCEKIVYLTITTKVTRITLNSENAKKEYTQGETLNVTGLKLTVNTSDGCTETVDVTEGMVTGFNGDTPGKQTLTVTYGGCTATYEVEVLPKVFRITVVGGTANPAQAVHGARIEIKANAPATGKYFKCWSSEPSIGGNAYDRSAMETTFTMPDEAVTVTAVYDDILVDTIPEQTYTGAEIEPALSVKLNGATEALAEGTDYEVAYADNVNIGIATATVTLKAPRVGSKSVSFNIEKRPVTFIGVSETKEYTGAEIGISAVNASGLADGHTHNVTFSAKGTEANTYDGKITAKDAVVIESGTQDVTANYDITVENGALTITPTDEALEISLAGSAYTYDGAAKAIDSAPASGAKTGATTFEYSFQKDGVYTADLSSLTKTEAGSYTVYVRGTNPNYANTAETTATRAIAPAGVTITVNSASKQEGQADPAFTGTVTGLVTEGDLGEITYVREGSDEAPGSYPGALDASYTANPNYDVTVVKGDFEITPLPVYTVTYEVVNGTWADGTNAPRMETVKEGKNPAQVPTGMKPARNCEGGAWSSNPNGAEIRGNTTFTYTFTQKQATPTAGTGGSTGSDVKTIADFCGYELTGIGAGVAEYAKQRCDDHQAVADQAKALLEKASTPEETLEAWRAVVALWREALDEEYSAFLAAPADEETRLLIEAEREAFFAQLAAHEAALALLYPDDPAHVARRVAEALERRVAELCFARRHGRPLTFDETGAKKLPDAEECERCRREVEINAEDGAEDKGEILREILCDAHRALAKEEWLEEARRLMGERIPEGDTEGNAEIEAVIQADLAAFEEWLAARKALAEALYPQKPELVEEVLALAARARALELCEDGE